MEKLIFRNYGNDEVFYDGGLYISDIDEDWKFHYIACFDFNRNEKTAHYVCGEFSTTEDWINLTEVIEFAKENDFYQKEMSDIYSPYFALAVIKCYGIENCPQNYDIITDIYRIEREVDEWQDLADFIPMPAL